MKIDLVVLLFACFVRSFVQQSDKTKAENRNFIKTKDKSHE